MFRPMALTVVFALVGSLLLSADAHPGARAQLFLDKSRRRARAPLRAVGCAASTCRRARRLRSRTAGPVHRRRARAPGRREPRRRSASAREFIPQLDEGDIALQRRAAAVGRPLGGGRGHRPDRARAAALPGGERPSSRAPAAPRSPPTRWASELSDVFVILKPQDRVDDGRAPRPSWSRRWTQALDEAVPGIGLSLHAADRDAHQRADRRRPAPTWPSSSSATTSTTLAQARRSEIARVLATVPGAADVRLEQIAGLPVLAREGGPGRVARYGHPGRRRAGRRRSRSRGQAGGHGARRAAPLRPGRSASPTSSTRRSTRSGSIPVASPRAASDPARRSSPTIARGHGSVQISRESGQRRIVVELNVRGRDVGVVRGRGAGARSRADVQLPTGYYIRLGRPVREPAGGQRAPGGRRPARARRSSSRCSSSHSARCARRRSST